jgi:hypothetical protein
MLAEKFFLFLETIISHLTDTARYPDGAPKGRQQSAHVPIQTSIAWGKSKHGGDACPRNDPEQWQQKLDRMRWGPIGPSNPAPQKVWSGPAALDVLHIDGARLARTNNLLRLGCVPIGAVTDE